MELRVMTRARKSSLFYEPGLDQLQFIVRMLNDEIKGVEVRRLVTAWKESGPNLLELWLKFPELKEKMTPGRFFIHPYGIGGQIMNLPNGAVNPGPTSPEAALAMFTSLILHPQLEAFGGPCKRCSKYYLRRTTRQTVYCSRQCGAATNAALHTRVRRENEHKEKLNMARKAIADWTPSRTNREWKRRVALKSKVTVKWLTRALNKGELAPPEKLTQHQRS
jgi:hypothetical protein